MDGDQDTTTTKRSPNCRENWLATQWIGYLVGLLLIYHGSVNENGSSALKILSGLSLIGGAKVLPTEQIDKVLNTPIADLVKLKR